MINPATGKEISFDLAEPIWNLERLFRAALDEYKDCPGWEPVLRNARKALDRLWREV